MRRGAREPGWTCCSFIKTLCLFPSRSAACCVAEKRTVRSAKVVAVVIDKVAISVISVRVQVRAKRKSLCCV